MAKRNQRPSVRVSKRQLYDKIEEQQREMGQLRAQHDDLARARKHANERAEKAERKVDQLYAMSVPQSTRRVVRTYVIEGDPVWVAQTLATSLQDGRTAIGLLPGGGVRNAITCVTTEDVTTRQDQLRAPDRLRQHDGPGTGGHGPSQPVEYARNA